ncbi:RNA helicase [Hymenopellis radicata]|nr:RNA helicase [Hymenopellis radicata]
MVAICPNILSSGTCNAPGTCSYNHKVTTCEPCKKIFASATIYNAHLRSGRHKAAASLVSSTGWLHCSVCDTHMCGQKFWLLHVNTPRHGQKCRSAGVAVDVAPEEVQVVPNHKLCITCSRQIPTKTYNNHIATRKHLAKEKFASYTAVLEEAEGDKHGVSVSGEFDFGVVEVAQATIGVRKSGTISTDVRTANIRLVSSVLASSKNTAPASSSFEVSTSGARLTSRMPITLILTAQQSYAGREEDRLELLFQDVQLGTQFLISKPLRIIVGNREQYQALQPTIPFKPKRRSARHPETAIEPGVKAPSLGVVPYVTKLPLADIPMRILLPSTLNANQGVYSRFFKHLIWIEEYKASRDLEHYDITGAKLTNYNQYYYVDVPGLAENRPSVLVGDSILVRRSDAPEGHWFEGCVHVVRQAEVGLRFGRKFTGTVNDRFTVRFKLNRYPLRRQHQALDAAFAPERLLFPPSIEGVPMVPSNQTMRRSYNPLIDKNDRQRMAVDSIVRAPAGSVPFVIFGPPGTGKTVTMVEAIRQVIRSNPNAKILACAPSNSAADLIALRLTELGSSKLFRCPDVLQSFTYKADGQFSIPLASSVARFTVCVTTCVSASVFFGIGVPRGHFTHIFIDEAGQATEPESMIAVKTMADNNTNVVLSGDPKQLGPIVRSAVAREFGLETSYIERLMKLAMYDGENGNARCVVKLTNNFRSHCAILKFPNERFYNNDLVPCGIPTTSIWKKFPILFIGMSGKDDREASSPSFFNIQEALMVKEKVEALRGDRKLRLSDADIGIIAPYHAQVQKIRRLLSTSASGIKVGSVEEFQGQERKVIIISTVRSSREFVEYDLRHTLGFVASPRRFNVAVTRAKALLIIIGDPLVLSLDPLWRQFLNYIHKNGGWTGKGISWDPEEVVNEAGGYDVAIREAAEQDMNEFTRQMESLTLAGLDDEDVDINVDRPWNRDDE